MTCLNRYRYRGKSSESVDAVELSINTLTVDLSAICSCTAVATAAVRCSFKLEKVAIIEMYCHLRPPDAIAVAT